MENNHPYPSVPSEKCIKIPRQINKDVPRSLDKKKCFSTKPVTGSGYGGGSSGGGGYGGGSVPVYQDTSGYSSSSSPSYSPSYSSSSSSSGSYSSPHFSSSSSGSYSSPQSNSGYDQKRSVSAEIAPSDSDISWGIAH